MTNIYTLDEIWQAFCDQAQPDHKYVEDLIWHIENDKSPGKAISFAADLRCKYTISAVAKHLDHTDEYVREMTASYLCRLLANGHPDIDAYAAKLYHTAKYDDYIGNRALIANFMNCIIDVVSREMQIKIAELIHAYTRSGQNTMCAYHGILASLGEKYDASILASPYPDFVDEAKVQEFRKKYNI